MASHNQFPDLAKNNSTFELVKDALIKQRKMRTLVKSILQYHQQEKFLRPFHKRKDFSLERHSLPENISFEFYLFFRTFYNPDIDDLAPFSKEQLPLQFGLLEHELEFMEYDFNEIKLKFMLFSAISCSSMRLFFLETHKIDVLPLMNPLGHCELMFQDYQNIYGRGCNSIYIHTSPQKQYYLHVADSLEQWLESHYKKLKQDQIMMMDGKLSQFLRMDNV